MRYVDLQLKMAFLLAAWFIPAWTQPAAAQPLKSGPDRYYARMNTEKGTIEIELFAREAPKAVKNFRFLAIGHHYDGVTFHRIIKGFMIQGGDPKGDGTGGESIWGGKLEDEIEPDSPLYRRGYKRGIVAMANAGPDTNGSQFFIMHRDYPLPAKYVIIGQVVAGMEVVDALAEMPVTRGADGNLSRPLAPPRILSVTISPRRTPGARPVRAAQ
ncbi:MAG: peptidylprolyl isomerase [Acidobacteriota bacterium]